MADKKELGHIPRSTQSSPADKRTIETLSQIRKYSNYVALENLENPGESQEKNKKHL